MELETQNQQVHANIFEVVYHKWLKSKEGEWFVSYQTKLISSMKLHILPAIGSLPIHEVNALIRYFLFEACRKRIHSYLLTFYM